MTLFVGFLDPVAHRLHYCNAGHEPPALFVPGRAPQRLESTGPPVGHIPLPFTGAELPPGALLCIWSDGIPEAFRHGARLEQFTAERLLGTLETLGDRPGDEIVTTVFAHVDEFLRDAHARDDRTILVVRRQTTAALPAD